MQHAGPRSSTASFFNFLLQLRWTSCQHVTCMLVRLHELGMCTHVVALNKDRIPPPAAKRRTGGAGKASFLLVAAAAISAVLGSRKASRNGRYFDVSTAMRLRLRRSALAYSVAIAILTHPAMAKNRIKYSQLGLDLPCQIPGLQLLKLQPSKATFLVPSRRLIPLF